MVTNTVGDPDREQMVTAAVALAATMGPTVAAESVETEPAAGDSWHLAVDTDEAAVQQSRCCS
jgi:EAL domain-containing protein (putative c-di-GMP-specific phosphodiesterase class I)